jgi:hypothetical protein
MARPEVSIDVPVNPEQLRKPELDALVRPAAIGFLSEYVTKADLLDALARIQRRAEQRPAWVPVVDPHGEPIERAADNDEVLPPRFVEVVGFPELGSIRVQLPESYDDRPELAMAPSGIGELEAVLYTLLIAAADEDTSLDVKLDADANEALVPEGERWWSREPVRSRTAADDPGVASELLATCETLGGRTVEDNTDAALEAVTTALAGAGDWRHGRRWVLDVWGPGDDTATRAVARATLAGWALGGRSGLVAYVYGGALHGELGLLDEPTPLHSYVLCVERAADGTGMVEGVYRLNLGCPGSHWCHRGGCDGITSNVVDEELAGIVRQGLAASDDLEAYQRLYGAGAEDGFVDTVLDHADAVLSAAGWQELERSTWEGGMEELLLRRGPHCLLVSYDPVTRQVRMGDGRNELEMTLQLLADDGLLIGEEGSERVDVSADAAGRWDDDLLTAAEDFLRGRIAKLPMGDKTAQAAMLGLHPHADGSLVSPNSGELTDAQLEQMFRGIGVLDAV